MRIYLPATSTLLRRLLAAGELAAGELAPLTGFAVTPGLREWYRDDDLEALEYAAMLDAARASLRLLDADPDAARRRVVLAAEVGEESVVVRDDLDRGVVRLPEAVVAQAVACAHVDGPDAEAAVTAAARAVDAADLGEQAAQDLVDDAEGFELAWYDASELPALLDEL